MVTSNFPSTSRKSKSLKRSGIDGLLYGQQIIELSDSEDGVPPSAKHRKLSHRAELSVQPSVQIAEQSSDDELLITRVGRSTSGVSKSVAASIRDSSSEINGNASLSPTDLVVAAASMPSRSLPVSGPAHGVSRLVAASSNAACDNLDDAEDTEDESFSGVDVRFSKIIGPPDYDGSTFAADSEDEQIASFAGAMWSRIDTEIAENVQNRPNAEPESLSSSQRTVATNSSAQHPHIDRIARSPRTTSVIDLTDDTSWAARPSREKGSASQATAKAVPLFAAGVVPRTSLASPTTEHLKAAQKREAVFLSAFQQRWWPRGWTLRAAVGEVNATVHPSTKKFSPEEGELQLRNLATQGKLAIRHDHVYHPDQDPGPEAPPPPSKTDGLIRAQRFEQRLQDLNNSPVVSPYGKISANRFHLFKRQLQDQVSTDQLFANNKKEETLVRCLEELNRDLDTRQKLSLKEVSAAFRYLSKQGDVVLEDETIRFTEKGTN